MRFALSLITDTFPLLSQRSQTFSNPHLKIFTKRLIGISLAIHLQKTPIFHLPRLFPSLVSCQQQHLHFKILQKQPRSGRFTRRASLFPSPFFFPNTHKDCYPNLHRFVPPLFTIAETPNNFVLGKVTRARDS